MNTLLVIKKTSLEFMKQVEFLSHESIYFLCDYLMQRLINCRAEGSRANVNALQLRSCTLKAY